MRYARLRNTSASLPHITECHDDLRSRGDPKSRTQ